MAANLQGLNSNFRARLDQLAQHCGLTIISGFRSIEKQEALWKQALKKYKDEEIADNWVARPPSAGGTGGNHPAGIAADLDGDLDCAQANASKFGLHFPMPWEPWHVEPIDKQGLMQAGAYTKPPGMTPAEPVDPLGTLANNLHSVFGQGAGGLKKDVTEFNPDLTKPEMAGAVDLGAVGQGQGVGGSVGAGVIGSDDLTRFMEAIKQVESGGNYQIKGPMTPYGQATGAYQWLDSTWNNYKGYKRAADAPPAVQEERARRDMQALYAKYGDWGQVAMAWHGGPNQKLWGPKTQGYRTKVLGLFGGG